MSAASAARELATARQRAAADPQVSAWVSANAGSGKTRVLTDRVARLLLAGAEPSKILCLTYTKAAAAEMSKRLFDTLGEWSTASDEDLRSALAKICGDDAPIPDLRLARRLFARALETPGGLKIETIHAFCERVLQRFPVEAGLAPEFTVIDEREAEALLIHARKEIFRDGIEMEDPVLADAVASLLGAEGEANFDAILKEGLQNGARIERFLDSVGEMPLELVVRTAFGLGADDTEEQVCASCLADEAFDRSVIAAGAELLESGKKTDVERAAKIRAYLASNGDVEDFEAYTGAFFTQKGEPSKSLITKGLAEASPAIAEALSREQARIEHWLDRLRAARTAEKSIAALRILSHVLSTYRSLKATRRALDYEDLVLKTLALLKDTSHAWVHFKLDGGIDHVLIDEAQDTSPDQWEIIRHLTEEFFALEAADDARHRTIFAVGDEKQSIYSFQGADPREFAAMRKHFAARVEGSGRAWEPSALEVSFRSVRHVLGAVDATFASESARAALTAEADEIRHEAERIAHHGLVELWPAMTGVKQDLSVHEDWTRPVDERPLGAPEAQLAAKVAGLIRNWTDAGVPLNAIAEGGVPGRAIEAGDVLILVRQRRGLFYEMIRALNRARLPVAGTDRMVLCEEAAFLDLDALGRFCLLPEDDLALAEVLKGPFIALDDDALAQLAVGRKGSLWQALRHAGEAFEAQRRWLESAIDRSKKKRPFEFYKEILDGPDKKRRAFVERLGLDAREVIDEFLSLALAQEQEEVPSLQGFLRFAQERGAVIKRDMEEAAGRVRVMTVHGAKGLEAPIVFLIDTCTLPQSRGRWLMGEAENPDALPVPILRPRADARDSLAKARVAAEDRRRTDEYLRLLYVAMTRAKDRLYVTGVARGETAQAGSWHALVEEALGGLEEVEEVETEAGGTLLRYGVLPEGKGAAVPVAAAPAKPELPPWAKAPVVAEAGDLRRTPSGLFAGEAETLPPVIAPVRSEEDPLLRGQAIHKLLQLFPDVPPAARPGVAERLLALASYAPLRARARELVAEANRVIEDERFAAVFGPGSRAEVPIAGALALPNGRRLLISGQIDRLVVEPDRILVVDFKTNRPAPKTAGEVPRAYHHQMAAYARLLTRVFRERAVKCALVFTAGPHLVELDVAGIDIAAGAGAGA